MKRINMPKEVESIITQLQEHGYEAFAVGGCVRDAFLGRTPHDWDITGEGCFFQISGPNTASDPIEE